MSLYKLFKYFNNNSVIAVNSLNNYYKNNRYIIICYLLYY